jgi:hypothetical protein
MTVKALVIPPDELVVDMLRRLLADAEAGNIQAIAIATEVTDRSIGTAFAGAVDVWRMIGAIEDLKRRLMESTR